MSLIKCKECGRSISDSAQNCPNCGWAVVKPTEEELQEGHDKMSYCPVCLDSINETIPGRYEGMKAAIDGQYISIYKCDSCGTRIKPIHPKYGYGYYYLRAEEKKGALAGYSDVDKLIKEELKQNPLFNEEKYTAREEDYAARVRELKYSSSANAPKCPTCGSTNIEKISTASKVVGASLFGLFSNTARSQYKCKNCGYKW